MKKLIRIFPVYKGTQPFVDDFGIGYLAKHGIKYVSNALFADILLVGTPEMRRSGLFRKLFPAKKMLSWTNEPRLDTQLHNFKSSRKVVMNVYSGNVFLHNLHFLGSYHFDFTNNLGIDLQNPPGKLLTAKLLQQKKLFCAALYVYKDPERNRLLINNKDISLNAERQNIALHFYRQGKADIYGSGWPPDIIVKEESGYDAGINDWWTRKISVLSNYRFNICLENTSYPNYCTEKIWHAIAGGCLPVYDSRGNAIYDTFPRNSFIDVADFSSYDAMLKYMEALPDEEHISRYNTCLRVMHDCCRQRLSNSDMKTDIIDEFIKGAKGLVGGR